VRPRWASPGNAGVLAAYRELLTDLVIDVGDADAADGGEVTIHVTDTRIHQRHAAARLASHHGVDMTLSATPYRDP
jgi:hypothetical protein